MKPVFNQLLSGGSLWLCLLLLSSTSLWATGPDNTREFTKTINKQYDIAADGLVELSNKYGKIDIKTWDQNRVRISVKIVVDAKNEDQAQEVFDRISINFFSNPNSAGATTEIATKKSSWWNWGDDSNDFSINYEVNMPAGGRLDVDAKYCDVYSAAIGGEGDFSVKYGNFKLDGLGEDSKIYLAYGNGTIINARDLRLELAYGNLDIDEASDISMEVKYAQLNVNKAGDITGESRYSNFTLGDVRLFRNEGKYDNVEIQSADEVVVETHYTNVHVHRLARRMNLEMAYGAAKADLVESSFSEINVYGRYTDFKLNMDDAVRCEVDLSTTYADIRVPSDMNKNYDHRDGKLHEVRGTMGGGGNAIVKARLNYGGITLRNN